MYNTDLPTRAELPSAIKLMQSTILAAIVALTLLIMLVTQAGTDPYFSLSLTGWERGRFIRFHGLAQWIGWLWPFAALLFLLIQVADPHRIRAPASPSRSG